MSKIIPAKNVFERLLPIIEELEKVVCGNSVNHGFIYRYGTFMSGRDEGGVFALFGADQESILEHHIRYLDKKFTETASTRSRRYYDAAEDHWYADYFIYYPWEPEDDHDPFSGQSNEVKF